MKSIFTHRWVMTGLICIVGAAAVAAVGIRLSKVKASKVSLSAAPAAVVGSAPALIFIDNLADGYLAATRLSDPEGTRFHFMSSCKRTAATSSYILCARPTGNLLWPFEAVLMTQDMKPVKSERLEGVPSRARVSPDGKYFATTSFVAGDGYSSEIFSTRTRIFDTSADSKHSVDVESYDLIINGQSYRYTDTNVWGVTFVPGQERFFATAAFNGHRYLVDGSITNRTMVVLRDNVECPSLSPDGLRLAYKKRVESGQVVRWRFYLLDLITNEETALAEERSVDDQIAWLDDQTLMYAVPGEGNRPDVWSLELGGGKPKMLLRGAESPTVFKSLSQD